MVITSTPALVLCRDVTHGGPPALQSGSRPSYSLLFGLNADVVPPFVVNGVGEAYAVKGLFVADASVFPTSVAVPPQLSVMAFALRTAQHIAEKS